MGVKVDAALALAVLGLVVAVTVWAFLVIKGCDK